MFDLAGFQRNLLLVAAGLDDPHGLAIKDEFENSSRRRTGSPLTAGRHDRGLPTAIGWKKDGQGNTRPGWKRSQLNRLRREHRRSQWRTKRERNLGYSLGEVRRIVSALELPDSLCEQACMLFRRAQAEDLCQGRSLEGVTAASVYAVYRCNGLGRTLEESSQLATCSRSDLECAYSAMNTELELPTTISRPQNFLPQLAATLEVPDAIRHRTTRYAHRATRVRGLPVQRPLTVGARRQRDGPGHGVTSYERLQYAERRAGSPR